MKPMEKPYVGITGVATPQETQRLVKLFNDYGFTMKSNHLPMIGVLVCDQTIVKGKREGDKRYPIKNDLVDVFSEASKGSLSMCHFNTRRSGFDVTLYDQIAEIYEGLFWYDDAQFDKLYEDGLCRSVQFNMNAPSFTDLANLKQTYKDSTHVLSLTGSLLKKYRNEELVELVHSYRSVADYVLIDPSGGRGELIDVNRATLLAKQIETHVPQIRLGFAGGLSGDNLYEVVSAIQDKMGHKDFCIDAEGKLRTGPTNKNSNLDFEKVEGYIAQASRLF